METVEVSTDSDRLSVVAIGDVHIGSLNSDLDSFQGALRYAKDNGSMVLFMGDLVDSTSASDPRFDPMNVDRKRMTIGEQTEYMEEKNEKRKI